tara:strand:+ start:152 stop:550 length:399 start_codon:yes stop_codon:yes gene_type:complete
MEPNFYDNQKFITELTDKDLKNNTINNKRFKNKEALIMFYAPWCPHCVDSKELFIKTSKIMQDIVPLGAVNCTNPNTIKLQKIFEIQGFPTILEFYNGKKMGIYNGGRDPISITSYYCSQKNLFCNDDIKNI